MTPTLLDGLAADLDAAFPALLDEYGSMVATLAARSTDATTGEEITQDVFVRAYRALGGYEPERIAALDIRPWLVTITRNLVRNEYRRRARRPVTASIWVDDAAPTAAGATADPGVVVAERDDAVHRLDQLLDQLTEPQRDAVMLRHVVGLSTREVASTLECPEGTVKSHLSRGLASMRAALETDREAS